MPDMTPDAATDHLASLSRRRPKAVLRSHEGEEESSARAQRFLSGVRANAGVRPALISARVIGPSSSAGVPWPPGLGRSSSSHPIIDASTTPQPLRKPPLS